MNKSIWSKVNTLSLNKDHLEVWPINTKVIQSYLTIKMSQYSQHIQQSKTVFVKPRTESKSLPCFYMKKVHIMHCFYFLCSNYPLPPYSVQSLAQSCPTLCDPMKHSTQGLPVHHQLPEFTQTHVHWVGDAIQPSHPLSSPSPPAFNLSQHHIFSNESGLRISSVQFSCSVVSESLRPHESQHARAPCPSPTRRVYRNHVHQVSDGISHLILCRPLLLLPPILPSITIFSNESTLRMRWPNYWSFSFSISPSSEHP